MIRRKHLQLVPDGDPYSTSDAVNDRLIRFSDKGDWIIRPINSIDNSTEAIQVAGNEFERFDTCGQRYDVRTLPFEIIDSEYASVPWVEGSDLSTLVITEPESKIALDAIAGVTLTIADYLKESEKESNESYILSDIGKLANYVTDGQITWLVDIEPRLAPNSSIYRDRLRGKAREMARRLLFSRTPSHVEATNRISST